MNLVAAINLLTEIGDRVEDATAVFNVDRSSIAGALVMHVDATSGIARVAVEDDSVRVTLRRDSSRKPAIETVFTGEAATPDEVAEFIRFILRP